MGDKLREEIPGVVRLIISGLAGLVVLGLTAFVGQNHSDVQALQSQHMETAKKLSTLEEWSAGEKERMNEIKISLHEINQKVEVIAERIRR